MPVVCAAIGSHVDIYGPGPCCSQRPYDGQWSVFSQEAMLISVVCGTTKGHEDILSLCFCLKQYLSL